MTSERDAALKDKDDKLGGLNAVLYDRLPIREWDRTPRGRRTCLRASWRRSPPARSAVAR